MSKRRIEGADPVDHSRQRALLVEGGHDRDDATATHDGGPVRDADEVEHASRSMRVGVLVEHSLACARTHRRGLGRITEEIPIGRERLLRVVHDDQLAPRLEPPLDPLVRIGDDRRPGRSELERVGRSTRAERSRGSGE